jgi:hypothetical protein
MVMLGWSVVSGGTVNIAPIDTNPLLVGIRVRNPSSYLEGDEQFLSLMYHW